MSRRVIQRHGDSPGGQTPHVTDVTEDDVLQAARRLAEALADLPEFRALDEAGTHLAEDPAAQAAIEAFEARQKQSGWLVQAGLASREEQDELLRLRSEMMDQVSVRAYLEAQARFAAVCGEVARLIGVISGVSLSSRGCCG